ncbi:MAG: hypothetical protein ABFS12_12655, partial [Bacteroidota bacterium]
MINKIAIILIVLVSFNFAQEKEYLGIDEKTGRSILIGYADRTVFSDSNFAWWFNSGYKFYKTDSTIMKQFEPIDLDSITTTIVLGTWCSDSRREVPRFFKIVDQLKISEHPIKMFGVNREWRDEETEIDSLNIEFVPTF